MAAFLALFVLLILGELPMYFVLKYHLYYRGDLGLFTKYFLFLFIDVVILGFLYMVVFVQLLRRKPFGYVLASVVFVMNTLLWLRGYFLNDLLYRLSMESINRGEGFSLSPFYVLPFLLSLILSLVSIKYLKAR
jgi:hypothetical protein